MEADERLARISERLGHTFREPDHLLHALTHRSYAHEQPKSRVGGV